MRTGTRWKCWLSQTVDGALRRLFKTCIGDQTSGFRVYQAEALRGLRFASDGFAFLLEILTLARARGYRVVEHPVTFRYRRRGRSKFVLGSMALSYLGFFARSSRPASRAPAAGGPAGRVDR
jgi:hypothetical protein